MELRKNFRNSSNRDTGRAGGQSPAPAGNSKTPSKMIVTNADQFAIHRSRLFGVAYRMLGSVSEAEDMVQETFLRWHAQDTATIDNPRAWLVSAITRLCIDQLRSARRKREEYYGVWLPEPLVEDHAPSPADHAALADSLTMAFMMMLESLAPEERAVFLLREAFSHDYGEIARIVGKNEAACRQIVSRARSHLAEGRTRFDADAQQAGEVVKRFLAACDSGETAELLSVLAENVTLYSDGGGRVRSVGRPIRTADHVSRFFISVRRRFPIHADYRHVRVNDRPGFLVVVDGAIRDVYAFDIEDGRVTAIYVVRNPDKLRHLRGQHGLN